MGTCNDVDNVMSIFKVHQRFHEATRDNTPDATNWQKVVVILQAEFRDGTLSKEIT